MLLGLHFGLRPRELRDPAFDKTGREIEYGVAVQIYVEDGRYEDALAEVDRFREHSAKRPNLDVQAGYLEGVVRCVWGEALQARGRTADARAQALQAEKAFDRPWQNATAWFQLGRLFLEISEFAGAEKYLARYLREDPGGPNAQEARRLLQHARAREAPRGG